MNKIKPSADLAEIIGIMIGDGSIYIKPKKTYQARIGGNSDTDRKYLLDWVKPLIEKVLKTRVRIRYHNSRKELFLCIDRKQNVLEFTKFGLPSGNKGKNNVGIPGWIFKENNYIKRCIRGLIDTDGSICPKTIKHPCASIWIASYIPKLREDLTYSFRILGYSPSKWANRINRPNVKQLCLGKSNEVIKYFKDIGSKNPKHIERFNKFIRAPVV